MFKNINSDSKHLISPKLLIHHLLMQTILTQYRQLSHKTFWGTKSNGVKAIHDAKFLEYYHLQGKN